MAGSSGGGGGSGAAGGLGTGASAGSGAGATPGAGAGPAKADGPTVKAGDVDVLGADGESQGMFNAQGRPVPPSVSVEPPGADKSAQAAKGLGVHLKSLGKGVSTADVDAKTSEVIVRRSGRIVERFASEAAIDEFVDKRRLSDADREALQKLGLIAEAKRRRVIADVAGILAESAEERAREAMGASLSPAAVRASLDLENSIGVEREKSRIWEELQRNDAETYAWVEKQRKARTQRVEPIKAAASAAGLSAAKSVEAKTGDTIEREAPFASPNVRINVIPPEIGAQYSQVGDKFYHPNNTKTVAFVDRGDKLETPSSAPQMAQSLVKIAEARGWDDLKVKGTEGFRREVWLEASVRGIHVDGYQPSELDKLELEKRNTFMQDRNSVEVRSEAYQKLSPQDGVRRDPTLAAAYGTEAAAKLLAERMHPESRGAFVQSVRTAVTHKLEAGEPVGIKLKVPEGQLIEHGAANYNFDKDEKRSYYVKLAEANGRERIYWGAGLQKALAAADPQPGDTVQLRVTESKGVVVEGNVRDAAGHVVGRQTVDSHRNEWQAQVTAKARSQSRQEPQPEQDRVR